MSELKHAWALGLLLLPIWLGLVAYRRRGSGGALAVPSLGAFRRTRPSLRVSLAGLPTWLRLLTLVALIAAIARPRAGERYQDVITHGVDMVVALDVSGSMKAEDFKPKNRLYVAKEVVRRFIETRRHDRLGLVAFAGKALTRCPLTLDYGLLKQVLESTSFDSIDEDGTAIGLAIGTAVNRLRRSDAKSKVAILVTDGINNRGAIDPFTAADLAKALGIRVYAIGVGTRGEAPIPVMTALGIQYVYERVPLDEDALRRIADTTGGYYFRATDPSSFEEALKRIGDLETTRLETRDYVIYDELFAPFLNIALGLLALEGLLRLTWLRRLP